MRCHAIAAALGIAMGFVLSRAGFSDFDEVHRMFRFADLRLTLTFALAVVVTGVGFRWLGTAEGFPKRRVHPGSVPGGLLLGAGWALCGACPAIVWVQLGEGHWLAGWSLLGIALGTWVYPSVHERWFRWPVESCRG